MEKLDLKVGDKVVVVGNWSKSIETVERITPKGETNCDNKVKENLNTMIEVVGHYVDEICEVAQMNSYCASIQDCRTIAKDFINGLKDAYESLNYDLGE